MKNLSKLNTFLTQPIFLKTLLKNVLLCDLMTGFERLESSAVRCEEQLEKPNVQYYNIVGSMEAPSKAFLLFFLLPDWLKLNHLKSRMQCGFSDIFSRHICSTVAETTGVTNYAASDARSVEPTK